jgi:hypothetical protein
MYAWREAAIASKQPIVKPDFKAAEKKERLGLFMMVFSISKDKNQFKF